MPGRKSGGLGRAVDVQQMTRPACGEHHRHLLRIDRLPAEEQILQRAEYSGIYLHHAIEQRGRQKQNIDATAAQSLTEPIRIEHVVPRDEL